MGKKAALLTGTGGGVIEVSAVVRRGLNAQSAGGSGSESDSSYNKMRWYERD